MMDHPVNARTEQSMPMIRHPNGHRFELAEIEGNHSECQIVAEDFGDDGTVETLRFVLTIIFDSPKLIVSQLIVKDFCAPGNILDLRGITTKSSLRFEDCKFKGLQMADASLRSLYVRGGYISKFEGTRLKLSGSLDLSPGQQVKPTGSRGWQRASVAYLELSGAEIGGNLDIDDITIGGVVDQGEIFAVRADGIKVRGNLFLRGVTARGEIRINGCNVGRNVDLQRSVLKNRDGYALSIAGGEIKGNLSFRLFPETTTESASLQTRRRRAKVIGAIRLNNSKIVGRTYLSNLCLPVAAGSGELSKQDWSRYAIEAEGVEVGASLHTEDLTLYAPLNLEDAVLKGSWIGRDMKLLTSHAPALIATGIEAAGLVNLELETNSFLSCVRAEFRGGLRLEKINFKPQSKRKKPDQPDHYPTLKNWRSLECGLDLDLAIVLGVFELEASVSRDGISPDLPDELSPEALEQKKRKWLGQQTWLCLDGATIPEIDKKVFASFKQFDFVDLMNCSYRYVITREPAPGDAKAKSSSAFWRDKAQDIAPLAGLSDLFGQKIDKLRHVLADPASKPPHPFLDTPNVDAWLKILDSEYAPLARRRKDTPNAGPNDTERDWRPRWAQGYGRLRLVVAALFNALLFLGFRRPYVLTLIALPLVATTWRHLSWAIGAILAGCLGGGLIIFMFAVTRRTAADDVLSAQETHASASVANRASLRVRAAGSVGTVTRAVGWFFGLGFGRNFAQRLGFLLRYDYYVPTAKASDPPAMLEVPIFHPQPYLQLARTMRDAGFDRHAAEVIIAMEWRRIWYGDLSPGQKALQYIKGRFLEFGFNRIRPIKYQFYLILLSTLFFQYAYFEGAIVPTKTNQVNMSERFPVDCPNTAPLIRSGLDQAQVQRKASTAPTVASPTPNPDPGKECWYSDSRAYVRFNSLLFAAETILPLADFGQKKNWIVEPVAGYAGEDQYVQQSWQTLDWNFIQSVLPFPVSAEGLKSANGGFWHDAFWTNDFWRTFSFHFFALWALFATVFGSLMTTLFIAGILGVITPKY